MLAIDWRKRLRTASFAFLLAVERGRNGRTESPSRRSDALMARPPSGPSTPMRAIALLVAGFAWPWANWTNWLNWALTSSGMAELRVKWLSG